MEISFYIIILKFLNNIIIFSIIKLWYIFLNQKQKGIPGKKIIDYLLER